MEPLERVELAMKALAAIVEQLSIEDPKGPTTARLIADSTLNMLKVWQEIDESA